MKHIFLYTLFTIIYSTLVYLESVIYLKTRVQTKSCVAGHTHEPRIFALLWPQCGGAADVTRLLGVFLGSCRWDILGKMTTCETCRVVTMRCSSSSCCRKRLRILLKKLPYYLPCEVMECRLLASFDLVQNMGVEDSTVNQMKKHLFVPFHCFP